MMRYGKKTALALAGIMFTAVAACSEDAAGPQLEEPAALESVQPAGGSVGVSVDATVVVTFDHAIAEGMEDFALLHEGTVTGPEVAGTWTRSADGTTLTFTPDAPLKPATDYVIHLGGGMMDVDGHVVDLEMHGVGMGGNWATQSMMSGGMGMGGQMGGHMGETHMGAGWEHASTGHYGMIFTFTTTSAQAGSAR